LRDGLKEGIAFLESATGKRFGDQSRPLLVSVRSGGPFDARLLETVLNVGCTTRAVRGLIHSTGHAAGVGLPPALPGKLAETAGSRPRATRGADLGTDRRRRRRERS
jgi:hypothetical protein